MDFGCWVWVNSPVESFCIRSIFFESRRQYPWIYSCWFHLFAVSNTTWSKNILKLSFVSYLEHRPFHKVLFSRLFKWKLEGSFVDGQRSIGFETRIAMVNVTQTLWIKVMKNKTSTTLLLLATTVIYSCNMEYNCACGIDGDEPYIYTICASSFDQAIDECSPPGSDCVLLERWFKRAKEAQLFLLKSFTNKKTY